MSRKWTIPAAAALVVAGTLAFAQGQGEEAQQPDGEVATDTTVQPVAFPHDLHAGQYRIDCQYCHYSAARSVDAGMPPVATCMGCHQVVPGRNNPQEVAKVREYWQEREPIPWVRVYKVADHAHFPHMRHVSAGVACQTCHGPVEEMGVVETVNQPLEMGWCVSCHRDMGASTDCTACHY